MSHMHTITVAIRVQADTPDRRLVAKELLSWITDMQDQRCSSAEVLPGGAEVGQTECTLSVAYAEAEGVKSTAGWAADAGLDDKPAEAWQPSAPTTCRVVGDAPLKQAVREVNERLGGRRVGA